MLSTCHCSFISGLLFRKERYSSFGTFIKHKFFTLLCPYVFFYIVAIASKLALEIVMNGVSRELFDGYITYFWQMFIAENSTTVIIAPLWFIPCLFAVECIYYFLSELKPLIMAFVCGIFTCVGWLLNSPYLTLESIVIPWNLPTAFFSIGFYAIGQLLSGKVKETIVWIQTNRNRVVISAAGTLLCAILLFPFALINGKISMGSRELNNGFLLYCTGIIGTAGVLFASILLEKSRFLRFCGQNSFCIMATHVLVRGIHLSSYGILDMEEYDATKISDKILPFIIVLVITLICTWIYSKTTAFIRKLRNK